MTHHILLKGKNHDKCIAFQESNSFGDQSLTYRYETTEGITKYHNELNQEGSWIDVKSMKKYAKQYFKEVWGK